MRTYANKIKAPQYYNLKTTCHIHGWKNLAPFAWDDDAGTLSFAMLVDDRPVDVTTKQLNDDILVDVASPAALKSTQKELINAAVSRALDLETDTRDLYKLSKSINSYYGALVKKGAGRMLRSPSLWEDAAKTLFTTNCSWDLTRIMCRSACSPNFSIATAQGDYPFPNVEKIARVTETRLKEKMRVGYRAGYLKNLAKRLKQEGDCLHIENSTEEELRAFFGNIEGFGPYATNHMLVLCGFYTQIPVDSVVRSYLKEYHQTEDYLDYIESYYGKWGQYKWWGMRLEQIANRTNWLGD